MKYNKYSKLIIILVLALLALVSVYKGCENALLFSQDFQWDCAKALSLGINPYDESVNPTGALNEGALGEFYKRFENIGAPQKMEANQFPSLFMLLLPYTFLGPDAARIAWMVSNLVFTGLIIWLLRKTFFKDMDEFLYVCLSLLMLAGTPYRNQLGVGQHTLFAFCFFLLAVYCSNRSDERKSFVWTTWTIIALFVSYFKYTLTAPLVLYFIYKKKYKEIIISILAHVVMTVVAAMWLGDSIINMIIKPLKVASVLSSEGGLDLGALMGGSSLAFLVAGAVAVVLFIITIMISKTTINGYGNLVFSVALLWSLILTYHRTYDFFVLIAVACIFTASNDMPEISVKVRKYYLGGFLITVFAVFFVLRVFHENLLSRMVVGTLYYAFTLAVTVLLLMPEKLNYTDSI